MWPDVLDVVKGMRRFTWTLLSHNAQVAGVENGRLTLSMVNAGARDSFVGSGSDEIVRQALITVLSVDWKVEAVVDPTTDAAQASAPAAATSPAGASGRAAAMATVAEDEAARPAQPGSEDTPSADDPDADDTGLTSQDLLARELGAKVIGEYDAS